MHGQLNVETGGGVLNMGGGVLPRVWGKTPFCKGLQKTFLQAEYHHWASFVGVKFMGVESGGGGTGGRVPRSKKRNSGGCSPQKVSYFSIFFLDTYGNFAFSIIFKIKWPKSEERLNFGGRWVWMPVDPSPQTKLRGDATGEIIDKRLDYMMILSVGVKGRVPPF